MIFLNITDHVVPILDIATTEDRKSILSAKYLGTGFFVAKGVFMTCRHVVENAQNTPCAVLKPISSEKQVVAQLRNIKYHPYADLALASIADVEDDAYKPLSVNLSNDLFLGQEIINYSYVENRRENYKVGVTPRLFKGYITRTSVDEKDDRLAYIEANFTALSGMSGSPILNDQAEVIGMIYRNFRSQILEDYFEEYTVSSDGSKQTKTEKAYKVVDYAQAVDLAKYRDFISPFLA